MGGYTTPIEALGPGAILGLPSNDEIIIVTNPKALTAKVIRGLDELTIEAQTEDGVMPIGLGVWRKYSIKNQLMVLELDPKLIKQNLGPEAINAIRHFFS